jgi:PadR family transcriptional regulator PadR
MSKPTDLVQGTLDLLILRVVALEPMHGWAIAQRIRQMSNCKRPWSRVSQ